MSLTTQTLNDSVVYIYIWQDLQKDTFYKKTPSNAGTIIITWHIQMQNEGLALGSYDSS